MVALRAIGGGSSSSFPSAGACLISRRGDILDPEGGGRSPYKP